MKKLLTAAFFVMFCAAAAQSQGLPAIFKKGTKNDSSAAIKMPAIFSKNRPGTNLAPEEVAAGLKQALQVGSERATGKLAAADGFFKNAALKILMPAEAKKLESTLRSLGMGKQVDAAILAMNRAAEDAAASATPIFVQAVKGITIQDAVAILRGGDAAATTYLHTKTNTALLDAFSPIISQSLKKVDATKYWTTITTAYNTVSREKVATDLTEYVTEKALSGIFLQLAQEEQKIRKDPAARTTELLRKVFAQ
jgi:hypothetical protein